MIEETRIPGYVSISNNRIVADGRVVFEMRNVPPRQFFNSAYEALGLNYQKFYKMDNLCKTGFLAAEVLLAQHKISADDAAMDTGILFQTANSSLDTDVLYRASTLTGASPSLFVYTLPNILIGELCIRHKIKGESACFIFPTFDALFQVNYLNSLLDSGKIKTGISGWADFYNEKFEALFYVAVKSAQQHLAEHTVENVDKIYNNP